MVPITLLNYKKEIILMDINSLGIFILQNSEDILITQSYCQNGLLDPICVFAKNNMELYVTSIGKVTNFFTLFVSNDGRNNKRIEEIKFYSTVKEASNIAKG